MFIFMGLIAALCACKNNATPLKDTLKDTVLHKTSAATDTTKATYDQAIKLIVKQPYIVEKKEQLEKSGDKILVLIPVPGDADTYCWGTWDGKSNFITAYYKMKVDLKKQTVLVISSKPEKVLQ